MGYDEERVKKNLPQTCLVSGLLRICILCDIIVVFFFSYFCLLLSLLLLLLLFVSFLVVGRTRRMWNVVCVGGKLNTVTHATHWPETF